MGALAGCTVPDQHSLLYYILFMRSFDEFEACNSYLYSISLNMNILSVIKSQTEPNLELRLSATAMTSGYWSNR